MIVACYIKNVNAQSSRVTITPSSPKAAFQNKGQLIPDLSYGNIRVVINTTNLFHGTREICKAAEILQKEQDVLLNYITKRQQKSRPTLAIKMIHDITSHLHLACAENKLHVEETKRIFGTPLDQPTEEGTVLKTMSKIARRVERQIVSLAIFGVIRIIFRL